MTSTMTIEQEYGAPAARSSASAGRAGSLSGASQASRRTAWWEYPLLRACGPGRPEALRSRAPSTSWP